MRFALFFGNRGFFPGELIASAREEVKAAVENKGFETILLSSELTRFGAVETPAEGKIYAEFLKENEGKFDGVIMSLPNFGDETGAISALRDCGVPILIQAYPDEIGKMDFSQRRDAFCGKFSIMDVFYQGNLPFTVFEPHVVHPSSEIFSGHLPKRTNDPHPRFFPDGQFDGQEGDGPDKEKYDPGKHKRAASKL